MKQTSRRAKPIQRMRADAETEDAALKLVSVPEGTLMVLRSYQDKVRELEPLCSQVAGLAEAFDRVREAPSVSDLNSSETEAWTWETLLGLIRSLRYVATGRAEPND